MAASIPSFTEMMLLIWVLWAVASCMTAFRIIFQWHLYRRLYAGDYLVIAGFIALTSLTAVNVKILPHGYLMAEYIKSLTDNPLTPLPLPADELVDRTIISLKWAFSLMPLFWTTVWAAKFSILFFIRLLLVGLPTYMMWWRICFAVVLILYLACFVSHFLVCLPIEQNWAPTGCSRPDDFGHADASIRFATGADIAADLLTMILPLHLLRNLTVTKLQKLWLVTIFSLSGIIIAVALVRLIQVSQATNDSKQDLLAAVNGLLLLAMWSQIESMVAIIVATLPALRFIGKKRIIQERIRTTYGFGLVTIGGTGRSRPRPWQHEADSEDSVARQGSQAELRLARIKALTEGRLDDKNVLRQILSLFIVFLLMIWFAIRFFTMGLQTNLEKITNCDDAHIPAYADARLQVLRPAPRILSWCKSPPTDRESLPVALDKKRNPLPRQTYHQPSMDHVPPVSSVEQSSAAIR
ncbi:hypothetical protein E4U22_003673 [Claviceps purpurea]|nr:hypothetical protein E4U22_003673 [Claviceps purpurea]